MKCPAAGTESITNAGRVRASSCTSDTPTSPSWCAPPTIRRTGHRICERCGASSSGSRALAMARYAFRVASRLRPAAAVYPRTVESVTQLGSPEESMSIPRIFRRMSRIRPPVAEPERLGAADRMREDEGVAHVQRVEHGGDAIGLGGERVIRLLGPGGRADAQRLDDDRPITRADEERDQLAETERRAEEPRNEH